MQRHTPTHFEKKQRIEQEMHWEVREFKRLLWTLLLFFTIFLSKKMYPERMLAIGEEVMAVLGSNSDMSSVFSRLGNSEDVLTGLEEFCIEVFGAQKEGNTEQNSFPAPLVPEASVGILANNAHINRVLHATATAAEEPEPDAAIPAVGTVLTIGRPQKQTLPDGYTMDELSFGALETVAPITGVLTSGYGYRDHPVNGKYSFHGGVDVAADSGTPIAAFADGQVEYVGEDSSYGLYLQIDHGNGIKSFYAHCRQVCVSKGQQVQRGETIALVGDTGMVTGPHLHLELKCADLRVDPSYYLCFDSAV